MPVPLPGLPWSPSFMAAREAALDGEAPRIEIGASRTKPGTINALVVSYFNSMAFQALAPETRRTRRNILERFRAEHGDKRSGMLKREHVNVMFAKKAATRFAARNWLKTVRALMQFAVTEGMLATDPTAGIKNLSGKTDGFRTWNEDDIAAFEARPDRHAGTAGAVEISGWPVARESHLEDPAHRRARKAPATRADAGGDSSNGYWYIRIDGKGYLGHRLAWLYMHGHFPDGLLDHKTRNPSSCRIADLRKATHSCARA